MLNELRFAFRSLSKAPAFATIAIVTLALAIGATTAVFTIVNALLIRPLPFKNPQQLVLIWEQFTQQGLDRIPVSAPEYVDYTKEARSFEQIAAFDYTSFSLTAGDTPEEIAGSVVWPNLFSLLGVQPIKGRAFTPEEVGEGHDDVVIISERLWQRRFNSDSAIIGKNLSMNGRTFTVVGVMPATFEFPLPIFGLQGGQFAQRVDIWKPIAFSKAELSSRGSRSYGVIGRLARGVTTRRAQAEIDTLTANWTQRFADNYTVGTGFGARVYPLHDQLVGPMRGGLLILLGAVGFVLLIACANLTTMLLARASSREREFAIRAALGAGPFRVLRQMLTESVLLAVLGGGAGVMLAFWGIDFLRVVGGHTVPRLGEVTIDVTVLLVSLVVSMGTGILFGIAPALASAKPELTEALKEGGRGSSTGRRRNRLRNALVVAEMALALVLLVGAGLLMKSFNRLQNVDPGFDPHNVLTMEFALPVTKYPRGKPVRDFYGEALRRFKNLPGVEAAALTSILPLSGTNSDSSFHIEGPDSRVTKVFPDEEIRVITPEYFRVLKTPIVQGRSFTEGDVAEAPQVAIINRALAKKYWPNEEALGKRINLDDSDPAKIQWITIVGIIADIHHQGLDVAPKPEFYLPHAQLSYRQMVLAIRSTQDPRSLASSIRNELRLIDPERPVANIRTLEMVASDSIAPRRLSVVLLGVFATIALLLASVGIYGVMSFLVVQRTHEIGVRMALGAQRTDVFRLVVGHGFKLVVIGTALGLLMALFCTRALAVLLYNVGRFDVPTFVGVTFTLGAVALLASYVPARRAMRADPMIALGHG
jgi:putative ABC transport system permease protein